MGMSETCKMWHDEYGACELPFRHDGLHARTPGGSTEPNLWDRTTCECPGCQQYEDKRTREAVKQKTILEAAQEIVHGPRRQAYGHPTPNHQRIADLWNGFLAGRKDASADLTPTEVVLMMLLLKIARLQETPQHADSWQDIAGYAACGAIIEGVDPS